MHTDHPPASTLHTSSTHLSTSIDIMTSSRLLLIAITVAITSSSSISANALSSSPKSKCLIKICHNKDCTKSGGGEHLMNMFRDLLPGGSDSDRHMIESSGCLSQCGKGPNVAMVRSDNKEQLYFGVADPITASAVLDVATGVEYPIQLLLAATSIVEAEHTTSMTKREAILTSVISDLTKGDPVLMNSFAHAHALFLRADARLDMSPANIAGAIEDARLASRIAPSERKVWRILANAHEAKGDIVEAVNAVRQWGVVDPSFATKAKKEIERLQSKLHMN